MKAAMKPEGTGRTPGERKTLPRTAMAGCRGYEYFPTHFLI